MELEAMLFNGLIFSNRYEYVNCDNTSSDITLITRRVTQRSIPGSLLFWLYKYGMSAMTNILFSISFAEGT